MDKIIKNYKDQVEDEDLVLCIKDGVAYQKDMSSLISYDEKYYRTYVKRKGTEIAKKLNSARSSLVEKYLPVKNCIDIGVGSGEFIETRNKPECINTFGYDINQFAVRWLRKRSLYRGLEHVQNFDAVTCWDSLEHMQNPGALITKCNKYVFVSIPIMKGLRSIRKSKHYKPNEHLYYFTKSGIKKYFKKRGFYLIEENQMEIDAGREDIYTYVFKREKD